MSSTPHSILIGCSGWSYPEWDGAFYPAGMDPSDYLAWYAGHFRIVEVDSTFYRVPIRTRTERVGLSVTASTNSNRWRRVWVFMNVEPAGGEASKQ